MADQSASIWVGTYFPEVNLSVAAGVGQLEDGVDLVLGHGSAKALEEQTKLVLFYEAARVGVKVVERLAELEDHGLVDELLNGLADTTVDGRAGRGVFRRAQPADEGAHGGQGAAPTRGRRPPKQSALL